MFPGTVDQVAEAVDRVVAHHNAFADKHGPLGPVESYVVGGRESFDHIGRVVRRHVAPGGRVLDFGCGRCVKAAVLADLGYAVVAVDDFGDPWHATDPARPERIRRFAADNDVAVADSLDAVAGRFDMVMLHDVLEHLHDSPRPLLERLVGLLHPGGYLFVTVPNAANLRKRLAVLRGKTNLPRFADYWHEEGPWRGHVREYVRGDLTELARHLGLEVVELRSCHHMLGKIPQPARPLFRLATVVAPGWRDTWLLLARVAR